MDHRLPEQHNCINIPKQRGWEEYKRERTTTMIKIQSSPEPEAIGIGSKSQSSRRNRLLILFSLIVILSFFLYFGFIKADYDKDGLNNEKELFKYKTNILNPDSDEDGLSDAEELIIGTSPTIADFDNDGLSDGYEVSNSHTNPIIADSDGDGLLDGVEINVYLTDPLDLDSDDDGLHDGEEVKIKTNPIKIDTDGDGLLDNEEIKYKTNPCAMDTDNDNINDKEEIRKYKTNPIIRDTDEDGLLDGEEVFLYCTNPLNNDTDKDDLLDDEEIYIYGTNPKLNDTDNDLLLDYYEIQIGTDPTYNWRQSYNEEAFKSALSFYLRSQVNFIVENISREYSNLDKAWSILSWINDHIKYNYSKAELNEYFIQTPYETVIRKSGICSDYALLTAALLLNANISRIYMLHINFVSPPGHAATAIEINGTMLILDQHLPLEPLGYYYEELLKNDRVFDNITFYVIELNKNKEIVISETYSWYSEQLKRMKYNITDEDVIFLSKLIKQKFLSSYPFYIEDLRLKENAEKDFYSLSETGKPANQYLPRGFKKGWLLYYYIKYYHPLIAEKLVDELPLFTIDEWKDVIMKCNKFYIKVGKVENQILMVMEIAR